MAFEQSNFSPIGSNATASPSLWSYRTDDDIDTVLAADYFADKKFQLEAGDFIHVDSTANGFSRIATIRYDGLGLPSFDFSPSNHELVLIGDDTTDQNPVAVDTPLQVCFGPAQGDATTDMQLAADGTITANKPGLYAFVGTFDVGRIGSSGGVAIIVLRGTRNGVQFQTPIVTEIDNPSIIIPLQFQATARLEAGDEIKIEMTRDGGGVNEGGLLSITTALWGSSSSARVVFTKLAR